ncbi:MAG: phage replisome organizer protein [Bacteroidales bacterium]|nr:phage replisome organizer protein [Bacteroidales bacterium]
MSGFIIIVLIDGKISLFLHFTKNKTKFAVAKQKFFCLQPVTKNCITMAETRYIKPYTDFGFKTEEHFAYEESLKTKFFLKNCTFIKFFLI